MIAPQVWINGRRQSPDGVHISVADRGLTLADGLFETMRARNGVVFRLRQHLARLEAGLAALDFPRLQSLDRAIGEAVDAAGAGDASVRLTVTRGVGPAGLAPPAEMHPTVIIGVIPMPAFSEGLYQNGLSAHVASGRRNQLSMTAGLKTLAFTDSVAALLEARRAGAEEAILLDTDGHCSEGSASNLFAWIGGRLVTPPLSCGALPGITRAVVFEVARELGIAASEGVFGLEDLQQAREAFLTSSIRGIAPLVRVESRAIEAGTPGEITRRIHDAYAQLFTRECGA